GDLTTLASGTVAALGVGRWHQLTLTFEGTKISAAIDGATVGSADDGSYGFGPAGLAVGLGDGGSTGPNLITQPTGDLPWNGPYQLGVGQVPGTVAPGTTPDGQ